MKTEIWLSVLTFIGALLVLWTTWMQFPKFKMKFLGFLIFLLGSCLAIYPYMDLNYIFNNNEPSKSEDSISEQIKNFNTRSVALPMSPTQNAIHKVDLSIDTEDLETLVKKNQAGWILLDASRGVQGQNRSWIESHFGTLQEVLQTEGVEKPVSVCWRRAPSFTLATGECHNRQVRWTLAPQENDLTRTSDGQATVRLQKIHQAKVVLFTHVLPDNLFSQEEKCLLQLSQQNICLVVEVLPGSTMAALNLTTKEKENNQLLEEFGLSYGQALDRTISDYTDPLNYKEMRVTSSNPEDHLCHGFKNGLIPQLEILETPWFTSQLSQVRTYKQLANLIDIFSKRVSCPGSINLELPLIQLQSSKAGLRTLIKSLQERLFWVTNSHRFVERLKKIEKIELAAPPQSSTVFLKSPEMVQDLGLTLISPVDFAEEQSLEIEVQGEVGKWNVFHIEPNAVRITLSGIRGHATLQLEGFIDSLKAPFLNIRTFLNMPGSHNALLLAYLFAILIATVQVASPNVTVRGSWLITFSSVFFILYIIVFSSFHFSRKLGSPQDPLIAFENFNPPTHLFLRDWPAEWFEQPRAQGEERVLAPMDLNSQWSQYLASSRQRAKTIMMDSKIQNSLKVSDSSVYLKPVGKASRSVVVWDNPRARNFYYRKSLTYQLALQGWKNLAQKEKDKDRENWIFSDETSLAAVAPKKDSVLLIPDFAFVNAEDLLTLNQFVNDGGILVFSEHVSSEANQIQGPPLSGLLGEKLNELGVGRTQISYFSKIIDFGLPVEVITAPHVVSDFQWVRGVSMGQGALVFMGVQPLDSNSQDLSLAVVNRLRGQTYSLKTKGDTCATTLFIKPFGPKEKLEEYAEQAKALGFNIKWFVDPVSFAAMMPVWEKAFLKDGVIFIDDGNAYNRYIGEKLWESFNNLRKGDSPLSLIFGSEAEVPPGYVEGPKGHLIVTVTLTSTVEKSVESWVAECLTGLAKPRVLSTQLKEDEIRRTLENLRKSGLTKTLEMDHYIERLGPVKGAGATIKELKFRKDNPLVVE